MEFLLRLGSRLGNRYVAAIALILLLGFGYAWLTGLNPAARGELLVKAREFLPLLMFATLGVLLFSGYPVAFILGGLALIFGLLGFLLGSFKIVHFFNFVPRIWGQAAENLVLVAIPTFIFMGVMMERSGIAQDLLYCVQLILKRVPGALALGVTIMGTILAAMTGIIGASVTMMTALALPTMIKQGYSHALSCGTIAAAGTLGILIPPSIMLIVMADLLTVSVGNLFSAAIVPGLTLSAMYLGFIFFAAKLKPSLAPPLPPDLLTVPKGKLLPLLWRAFFPPVFLIGLIKLSILLGWATPSEAGAVGAAGAIALAALWGRLSWKTMNAVCQSSARTISMVFFIIISATCFAFVYRQLGGDDIVEHWIKQSGLGSWGFVVMVMLIVFLLGFFLDWIEITLIVLPVFAPLVKTLDFGAHVPQADVVYWFLILLAVNLQTSFLTPPFGFALFYLKGIAPKEVKIQSIYRGIIPFVIIQLIGVILVVMFPQLALWLMHASYDN
jgi:tripartite ATP-independent transporter DctM subunit